ncbi:MAG: metalloregulator ArsR/SmtB family transcription factor [Verrucomicrobiota bacterium]|nr:metalloregulator ArsR/SmtB family transcription factor [Verrucomicrobiota bacterium]
MKTLTIRERAELLRQLGHPVRLAILEELMKGGKCVSDIRDLLEVPQPNISQHLTVLRQQRIVDFSEEGKLRCYYLKRPAFVHALFEFISGEYPEESASNTTTSEQMSCCSK